jgi:hypothetical protein
MFQIEDRLSTTLVFFVNHLLSGSDRLETDH